MKHVIFGLFLSALSAWASFETVFERSGGLETASYQEGITFYRQLAKAYDTIEMREMGQTDSGEPLHLVLFSSDGEFSIPQLKSQGKRFLMINNAIHAGEPDGVDASMMFLRDLASGKWKIPHVDRVVIGIIPFYNIGGALNRNSTTRVNQQGPKAYGFRGNARNYDLNRDFIKNDSRNARSFAEIFHLLDPEVYLETHVTNGSDHQYTLTLLTTQANKLGGSLGMYLNDTFEPQLMKRLAEEKVMATPYVNVFGSTPDKGFGQFLDGPRYSTGYTALFQTMGFMTETHSLKPFKQRVEATLAFIKILTQAVIERSDEIHQVRTKARQEVMAQREFPLAWGRDQSQWTDLNFHGFEPEMHPSKVTPGERLSYNRQRPFEKTVPFYNKYLPKDIVTKPHAFVIPKGWHPVIEALQRNHIEMKPASRTHEVEAEVYFIENYETSPSAYEGHYPHFNTTIKKSKEQITVHKGDWVIPASQIGIRYLLETLEPNAPDSFFNWNYFDTILRRKEYFSPYIFEDIAEKLLKENPKYKQAFEKKKAEDEAFAKDRRAQLQWLYAKSPHAEKAYLRYPVYRIIKP